LENLFDVRQSEFPRPGQGRRPCFVIGQAGCGAALEQKLDQSSPALNQRLTRSPSPTAGNGEFRSRAPGRGQGRRVDFDVSGVDVGSSDNVVVALRIHGSTPNFQHQPNSQDGEKPVQGRGWPASFDPQICEF